MLHFGHDPSYLICPLRPFSPAAEIHVGTALYVPAMVMNDLEVIKSVFTF